MPGLRDQKKEQTLQAITRVLRGLLRENDFEDIEVEDILSGAQVSRQTLYNYFQSKEAVLARLASDRHDAWRLNLHYSKDWPGTTAAKLERLYRSLKGEKFLWKALLLHVEPGEDRYIKDLHRLGREILSIGQARGEISDSFDASDLAWLLGSLQTRVLLDWALDRPRPHSLVRRQRLALGLFLKGATSLTKKS